MQSVEADDECTARWVAWTARYGCSARIDDREEAHHAALGVLAADETPDR